MVLQQSQSRRVIMNFARHFLVMACLTTFHLVSPQQSGAQFELTIFNRSREAEFNQYNQITFQCVDTETGDIQRNAIFFRNNINITLPRALNVPRGILFLVNRDLEGEYSCGTTIFGKVQSPPVKLVAFPDGTRPASVIGYGNEGSNVRLDCSIKPGPLVNQYFVTWRNASNTSIIFYELRPPRLRPIFTGPFRLSNHYNLDNDTFSLIISDIELEDGEIDYQCVLGVEDPSSNRQYVYSQTETANIRLSIFKAPEFVTEPNSMIRSVPPDNNVTFTCSVLSSPLPSHIVWRHRGIIRDNRSKYSISTNPSTAQDGGQLTSSTFTINDLSGFDSGRVECTAKYFTDNLELISEQSYEVILSVLDEPEDLNVIPIGDGGFIIQVTLKQPIILQVDLRIEYIDSRNNSNTFFRMSPVGFYNVSTINHIAISQRVPRIPKFRLRVGLSYGPINGPLFEDNIEYVRNPRDPTMISLTVLIVILVLIILLILIVIIFFACLLKRNKKVSNLVSNILSPVLKKQIKSLCNCCYQKGCCNRNATDDDGDGLSDEAAKKYVKGVRLAIEYGRNDSTVKGDLNRLLIDLTQDGTVDDGGEGGGANDHGAGDIELRRVAN